MKSWFKLLCRKEDLQLQGTLNGGQSFRWKVVDDIWTGVFGKRVWMLQQHDEYVLYQVFEAKNKNLESEEFYNNVLSEYFQLNLNLRQCFTEWSSKDPIFKKAAGQFYGIRILNQHLIENIFSFICSSNNNISRITGMVEKLATNFGEKICEIDGKEYFAFPEVLALAQNGVDSILKGAGFGYRSKYINLSAKLIVENDCEKWLHDLRQLPYKEAKNKLMTLTGIGPKVADCICLMSLKHLESIPVDTHVYQIARNFYMPQLPKQKTVTAKLYNNIGDHFRKLYGPYAGWAHTVLFCADLKKFQAQTQS